MRGLGITLPPDEGLSVPELLELAAHAQRSGFTMVTTGEVAVPEKVSRKLVELGADVV